jgi:hypothetical protein
MVRLFLVVDRALAVGRMSMDAAIGSGIRWCSWLISCRWQDLIWVDEEGVK